MHRLTRRPHANRISAAARRPGHVVMIVHNLSVPFDRRPWLQCRALSQAGHAVSVICPRGAHESSFERRSGVDIHRYAARESGGGFIGYGVEFVVGWLATARLLLRVRRRRRIDVIQACNPPDIYFTLAAPFKLFGTRFVFDQHDLSPELYEAREAGGRRVVRWALRTLERRSQHSADHVVVPNESYRQLAINRGGIDPTTVTVVRNGPDLSALTLRAADARLRKGHRYLCCYLGVMGPQDGVGVLVEAIRSVVRTYELRDCHFALLGYGECKDHAEKWIAEQGLSPWVTFTGRVDDEDISRYLSTADVGLAPEPPGDFNDRSTIVKVMEYMTFGLPIVAFDLAETRVSAGEAGVYVEGGADAYALQIAALLADPDQRKRRGRIGRERIDDHLSWQHQRRRYLDVIEGQFAHSGQAGYRGIPPDRERTQPRPRWT